MDLAALVNGIGSVGLFSTRIFLPAFITALLLRFGPELPLVHNLGLLGLVHLPHNAPTWFTSNTCLIILGILSLGEILAQKNPESRRLLQEFDVYLKGAAAMVTSIGVIVTAHAALENAAAFHGGNAAIGYPAMQPTLAGWGDALIPIVVALCTIRVAAVRRMVALAVYDHVEGTPLEHLVNWLEDAWVVFGVFLLVLLPLVMLAIIGIATGALWMLRRHLEVVEEQGKVPCTKCGSLIYRSAMACPVCRQAVAAPAEIGWLGLAEPYPTDNIPEHPYRLTEKRRCSVCATKRRPRRPFEPCHACGSTAMSEPEFTRIYTSYIGRRLPSALVVCVLFSLVPILGLIFGTIYYRMELVLPFSQYLPMGRRFLLRWAIRLLFVALILLQIIPVVGAVVIPVMALISYLAYRSAYTSLLMQPREQQVEAAIAPQPA
jgi:hypothetical protein